MVDDHTDSDVAFALLADDDEKQELSKAIIVLNKDVAALTNSVPTMGESIAEIRQSTSNASAKRDSQAIACSESKAKRQHKAQLNDGSNLLKKSVIVETLHDPGEFISPIFVRSKKDGTTRMILNLKSLNEHVVYLHFKMNTLKDAIRLMKPNCFMASIDLKDAYYSVPIAQAHQKYLKFQWGKKVVCFYVFPKQPSVLSS